MMDVGCLAGIPVHLDPLALALAGPRGAPDVADVIVVEAGPGDKVVIPPGWARVTANVGEGRETVGSWARVVDAHGGGGENPRR